MQQGICSVVKFGNSVHSQNLENTVTSKIVVHGQILRNL